MMASHYLALFFVAAGVAIVITAVGVRARRWAEVWHIGAALALICSPLMAHLIHKRSPVDSFWIPPVSMESILATLFAPFMQNTTLAVAYAVLVSLGVLWLWFRRPDRRSIILILLTLSLLPLAGVVLGSLAAPAFSLLYPPRAAISFVAPFLVLAGFVLGNLPNRWVSTSCFVLLGSLSLGTLVANNYYTVPTKLPNREGVAELTRIEQEIPSTLFVSLDPMWEARLGYKYYSAKFGFSSPVYVAPDGTRLTDLLERARSERKRHVALFQEQWGQTRSSGGWARTQRSDKKRTVRCSRMR